MFKGNISTWEAVALIGCISVIPLILAVPTTIAESYGTSSFLHTIYMAIISAIVFFILFKMYSRYKDQTLLDVANFLGGKFLMCVMGLLVLAYMLMTTLLTLSEFTENINDILFNEAPPAYITILFLIAIFFGAMAGEKGLFRAAAIVTPFAILGFLSMFITLFEDVDLTNFTPIFGSGIKNFFINDVYKLGQYESFILFFLISPNIKKYGKTITYSFLLTTMLMLVSFFILFGIFSYPTITEYHFPLYEVSRLISYGRFIQRVESLFILLWLMVTLISLTAGIVFSAFILQKIFNIQNYKRIIPALCSILISTSLIFSSYNKILFFKSAILGYIVPIFLVGVPFILMLFAMMKERIIKHEAS